MAIRDMETLILKVKNKKVVPLIEESVRCYNAHAYRASISTSFNAMFHDLCDKLDGLKETNASIRALYSEIERRIKEQEVYESYLIDNLASNNLISKLEKDILDGMRVMRNKSSHPTEHEPTAEEARYVFTTVIDLVLSKGKILSRSAADDILSLLKDNNYFPSKTDFKENKNIVANDVDSIHSSAINYLVSKVIENIIACPDEQNYVIFIVSLLNMKKDEINDIVLNQINKTKYTKDELKWLVVGLAIHHTEILSDKYSSRILSLISMASENTTYSMSSIRSIRRAIIVIAEKNPGLYKKTPQALKKEIWTRHSSWDACIACSSDELRGDFSEYFLKYLTSLIKINKTVHGYIQKRVDFINSNDSIFASKFDDLTLTKIVFGFLSSTLANLSPDVDDNPADEFLNNISTLIPNTYKKVTTFRSKNSEAYKKEAERSKVSAYITRLP